jgi:penicillin-binding protein 1A
MNHFQKLIVNLFRLTLGLLVAGAIFACYAFYYMQYKLPNVEVLKNIQLEVPLQIFTSDGKLVAEFGEKRCIPVTFDQIPLPLRQAVLATEDQRFYEHPGVDFFGLLRAIKQLATTGKKEQGASTIPMQVARNFFLSREKTYSRKFNEILLALMIDHAFSKDKILEMYLNKIYLGNRAYGVEAAAEIYFGKTLKELSLPEMAVIAGLAQAPSSNNPIANPESSLKRRNHVLQRMFEDGYIDHVAFEKAINTPINASYHGAKIEANAPYLAEMVRLAMYDKYGEEAYDGNFKVYTTVNSQIQDWAQEAVQTGLEAYTHRHPRPYRLPHINLGPYSSDVRQLWLNQLHDLPMGDKQYAAIMSSDSRSSTALLGNGKTITIPWKNLGWTHRSPEQIFKEGNVLLIKPNGDSWTLVETPVAESALVSLNPNSGAIYAVVGGYDFNKSTFNRATQSELQPGSSFKPFIYSAALAQGFTLASIVNDAPFVVNIPGQKSWRPQNSDHKFLGPIRLRPALAHSRNMVSIRLLEAIGVPNAIDYISRFGFDPKRVPRNLTMALGTAQVSPLEMASAYSVFANGGYKVTPYFIDHIVDGSTQKVIYKADPKIACPGCHDIYAMNPVLPPPNKVAAQVITPQNAFIMTSALQEVIRSGTGHAAATALKREDLAGKTGTTNDKFDAWFSGFNADVETTVWVGFDHPQTLHEYGAQAALPIWIEFMGKLLQGKPEHTLPEPPGLVYVRINPSNGLRSPAGDRSGVFEVFRAEDEPETESYANFYDYEKTGNHSPNEYYSNDGGSELF